jgi:hypothetical protein
MSAVAAVICTASGEILRGLRTTRAGPVLYPEMIIIGYTASKTITERHAFNTCKVQLQRRLCRQIPNSILPYQLTIGCIMSKCCSSFGSLRMFSGTRSLRWQIDIGCRPGNVCSPMMSIDRILLIEVEFEEFVVSNALEILESKSSGFVRAIIQCMSKNWAAYELTF